MYEVFSFVSAYVTVTLKENLTNTTKLQRCFKNLPFFSSEVFVIYFHFIEKKISTANVRYTNRGQNY